MSTFENDKMTIIHEMEKTLKTKFMAYASPLMRNEITVEDMIDFLNELDDDKFDRYEDMIKRHIDDFITYEYHGFEEMNAAIKNHNYGMPKTEDIMDYMYDEIYDEYYNEYISEDLKPSMIIPRWGVAILEDYVCVTDMFEECYEKDCDIKRSVESFQILWRSYASRCKSA